VLHVERALARDDGQWVLVEPKTKQSRRTVALTPIALAALRTRRLQQDREREASGAVGAYDGLVFTTEAGQPLGHSAVLRLFHDALAACQLPQVRFHDLRHTAASVHLGLGCTLEDVKHLLGHSSIALTSDTYGHYVEGRGRELAAGMQRALSPNR
jgi:integrase